MRLSVLPLLSLACGAIVEPSSPTIRNVIFTLVRGDDDAGLNALRESHRCLRTALDSRWAEPYDHIVFHEQNVDETTAKSLSADLGVRMVSVADDFVPPADAHVPPSSEELGSVGYRSMCSFMSMKWHKILSRYEYAMRVDEDVCLQRLPADPFAEMRSRDLVYTYGRQTLERHDLTLRTMPTWVADYVASHGLATPTSPYALVENMYFTNYFVSRVDFWARADVQQFLGAVASSRGIYTHRWGDAPIQSVALGLFARPAAVARLPTAYLHISTMNRVHLDGTETDGYSDPEVVLHPLTHAIHRNLQALNCSDAAANCTNATLSSAPPSPSAPPPPPSPAFPPSLPPVQYAALAPETLSGLAPSAIIGLTIALVLCVVLLAMIVLLATRSRLDCGPVSSKKLAKITFHWGRTASKFWFVVAPLLLAAYLGLATAGVPKIKQDRGSLFNWVPTSSRFYDQLLEWDTYVEDSVTDRTSAYFLVASDTEGENLLDDPVRWLNATLRIAQTAYTSARVQANDRDGKALDLSWRDFCFSVNHPILTQEIKSNGVTLFPGTGDAFKPCINPSVLDAFREGMWEFDGEQFPDDPLKAEKFESFKQIRGVANIAGALSPAYAGQVNDPTQYESFLDPEVAANRTRIIELLQTNTDCGPVGEKRGHWLSAATQPWGKLFGSFRGYNRGPGERQLEFVQSFVYTLYQDIPKEVIKSRKSVKNMDADAFRDANKEWLLAMEAALQQINDDEANFPGVRVTFFPSNGIDRMFEEVGDAQTTTIAVGYSCMLVFVLLSQLSRRAHTNLALLGGMGFLLILVGNAAAYGLIALAGMRFNHTMLQALPFLALGLGVDDLFLLLHAFKQVMSDHKGARRDMIVALTYMQAGASVTITSLCNAAVFFAACIIPIAALRDLLVSCGTVVLFNWLTAMLLLPALFSLWAACFEDASRRGESQEEALSRMTTNFAEANAALRKRVKGESTERAPWSMAEVVTQVYIQLARSRVLKLAFLAVGLALLVVFAAFIPKVEIGYRETDLAKKGSYLGQGIEDIYGQVFSQHSSELVVFGTGIDYPRDQRVVLETYNKLAATNWSAYGGDYGRCGVSSRMWLENMYDNPKVVPHFNATGDGSDPPWAFYEDFHLWRKPQVYLEPRYAAGDFSNIAFGGLFAALADRANSWPYTSADGPDDYSVDNKLRLSWDDVELDMTRLQSTRNRIQMVRDFKKINEESGLNIYMYGYLYVQIEQFLNLDHYFWQAAAVSMAAVFAISLLLGVSWLGAGLIGLFSIAICVQVYGSLYVLDIYYQTLACTSMLISIGISVEFIAHPVAAYEFATGTRAERLVQAMAHTGLPVIEGTVSSVFGFLFLAFSDFAFVVNYFFYIFLMICLFGAANGLVLLPAILALLGPASKDETDIVEVASPARKGRGSKADEAPGTGTISPAEVITEADITERSPFTRGAVPRKEAV